MHARAVGLIMVVSAALLTGCAPPVRMPADAPDPTAELAARVEAMPRPACEVDATEDDLRQMLPSDACPFGARDGACADGCSVHYFRDEEGPSAGHGELRFVGDALVYRTWTSSRDARADVARHAHRGRAHLDEYEAVETDGSGWEAEGVTPPRRTRQSHYRASGADCEVRRDASGVLDSEIRVETSIIESEGGLRAWRQSASGDGRSLVVRREPIGGGYWATISRRGPEEEAEIWTIERISPTEDGGRRIVSIRTREPSPDPRVEVWRLDALGRLVAHARAYGAAGRPVEQSERDPETGTTRFENDWACRQQREDGRTTVRESCRGREGERAERDEAGAVVRVERWRRGSREVLQIERDTRGRAVHATWERDGYSSVFSARFDAHGRQTFEVYRAETWASARVRSFDDAGRLVESRFLDAQRPVDGRPIPDDDALLALVLADRESDWFRRGTLRYEHGDGCAVDMRQELPAEHVFWFERDALR